MTNNEPQENNFKERILKNIETEDIKAYSKTHFLLRVILLIAVTIVTLIISVFLFNYVFFSLRISGHESLLGFGPQGVVPFLEFFPWPFLVVDIALIIILEWLLRKFRFGYRSPILYLLIGLFVVTVSAGYFIDRKTGFNDALLQQADHDYLPGPFGELYRERPRCISRKTRHMPVHHNRNQRQDPGGPGCRWRQYQPPDDHDRRAGELCRSELLECGRHDLRCGRRWPERHDSGIRHQPDHARREQLRGGFLNNRQWTTRSSGTLSWSEEVLRA